MFVLVERRIAGRDGDPLLNLRVLRAPGLVSGLAAVAILMVSYGGFLFTLALQLQDGLDESALRAGLTFAPSALAFGLCGFAALLAIATLAALPLARSTAKAPAV